MSNGVGPSSEFDSGPVVGKIAFELAFAFDSGNVVHIIRAVSPVTEDLHTVHELEAER